ncbi:MAG: DUF4468 domain-containing protein [Flavobacteriaceae bacterium]|nr:DUF4468 domain-containing protein [Flavobacteriaceae bacterium]
MVSKRLIVSLIFIFVSSISFAQLVKIDSETGEHKYDEVVQAEGLASAQLVNRAKKWADTYYAGTDSNLDSVGSVKRVCTYKFSWKLGSKTIPTALIYDLDIKVKDNRYRYIFSNFRVGSSAQGDIQAITLAKYISRFQERYHMGIEEPIDTHISKSIASMDNYMKTEKIVVEDDNW